MYHVNQLVICKSMNAFSMHSYGLIQMSRQLHRHLCVVGICETNIHINLQSNQLTVYLSYHTSFYILLQLNYQESIQNSAAKLRPSHQLWEDIVPLVINVINQPPWTHLSSDGITGKCLVVSLQLCLHSCADIVHGIHKFPWVQIQKICYMYLVESF